MSRSRTRSNLVICTVLAIVGIAGSSELQVRGGDPAEVAGQIDQKIEAELQANASPLAPLTSDEDYLRRVSLDITGTIPTAEEVTRFGIDPDPKKRERIVQEMLSSSKYASNWTHYWREVIYSRATDPRSRLSQRKFEEWLSQELSKDTGWDKIAKELITAKGDVQEVGSTALIFAQAAVAEDIAAETSRIFLGIQIQCANCHDHPTDRWKREEFHQLAAYFPRVRIQPVQDKTPRSFEIASVQGGRGRGGMMQSPDQLLRQADRNRDGKVASDEVQQRPQLKRLFERILDLADKDKDGALSQEELKDLPMPQMAGRGSPEHYMPDLDNPQDRGKKIDPSFFLNNSRLEAGKTDEERREVVANNIVLNEWFAKAYVNRIWNELTGEGFTMPVDDMGPDRSANYPEVLELLAQGFKQNGYRPKWLLETIVRTRTYQRALRSEKPKSNALFAAATPTRLRADQIFDSLDHILGLPNQVARIPGNGGGAAYLRDNSMRGQIVRLFGFDPSTPSEDVIGTIPQALFMMNSPQLQRGVNANGNTSLARILKENKTDEDAVGELYLLVLSRAPSEKELSISKTYISEVGNREEAFEDLLWSLLNSSEFLTRR